MKKLKRTNDFEISFEIKNEAFIRPPRDSQRNWLLNRAMKEAAENLQSLHSLSQSFVPGAESTGLSDRSQSDLDDTQIMEDWQIKVMQAMAEEACSRGGDILEIGFGRGIASDFIQSHEIRSHTIVECNENVLRRCEAWKAQHPGRDITILPKKWQDCTQEFREYDGIFFHTYPLNEEEFLNMVVNSSTFAEHFFDTAARHLKPGGAFSYLTNEIDSLSRAHQRALVRRFSSFTLRQLTDLNIPDNTRDAHWAQQIMIIRAIK